MRPTQHFDGLHIQPRDLALLCGLFESRFLTLFHIAEMFFDGRREMAKKRVQRLKSSGLLDARFRGFGIPHLICLSPAGLRFLGDGGHLSPYPRLSASAQLRRTRIRPLTIDHELAVADVKAAFGRSLRAKSDISLLEFGTWPRLYEFTAISSAGRVTVAPDGFLRIGHAQREESRFFVEVDRSTESTSVLISRIAAYRHFYRSGGFAARFGVPRDDYARAPFRVLVICKSPERRDSLARVLLEGRPHIRAFALFATSEDVSLNALGATWRAPIDIPTGAHLRHILGF